MQARVTVAIPTFNRKLFLKEALESVLAQDYSNVEIVVSDNASTDGTEDVVKGFSEKYNNIIYFRHKENVGGRLNWCKCLELATGDYCLLLSDDDVMMPGAINKMVEAFTVDTVVVIGNTIYIDECGDVIGGHDNPSGLLNENEFWEARLSKGYHDTPSGVMYVTKKGRDAINLVAEKTESAMDLAMDLVMSRHGSIKCISDKIVKYRVHGGNDSKNIMRCASSHVGLFNLLKTIAPDKRCESLLRNYCKSTICGYTWLSLKGGQLSLAKNCLSLLNGPFSKSFLESVFIFGRFFISRVYKRVLRYI